MQDKAIAIDVSWKIVKMKDPVLWARTIEESYLFTPPLRYVVNAQFLDYLKENLESVSSLCPGSDYTPLLGEPRRGSNILVERHRDRGVGDHLFMTGVYKYIHDMTAGTCKIYQYALHNRSAWLNGCPWLASEACFTGPICYETLRAYDYHWFVEEVTEYTLEQDQLNVYDALFRNIGIAPESVHERYKRPYCHLMDRDRSDADTFMWRLHRSRGIDLRNETYCVISPICHSALRSVPYSLWLELIQVLAKKMTVLVVGDDNNGLVPNAGVSYATFSSALETISSQSRNVVPLIGPMNPRLTMSLVSGSKFAVSADSGILYVAQGFRVPAVSIWGTHSPSVRIGYDKEYMDLAIHKTEACRNSPCYSYANWPTAKCPRGVEQTLCEPLAAFTLADVMAKIDAI